MKNIIFWLLAVLFIYLFISCQNSPKDDSISNSVTITNVIEINNISSSIILSSESTSKSLSSSSSSIYSSINNISSSSSNSSSKHSSIYHRKFRKNHKH